MNLLILGGTVFLGRHLTEAALARGHRVTLFNRGRHNPELFPETERIRGDRWEDLGLLAGRCWDGVIDTSGHMPRTVRASGERLAAAVQHYTFISSVLAYRDFSKVHGLSEHSPLTTSVDPTAQHPTPQTLGPLKALCEQELQSLVPGRLLIVRAGFLFGLHDPTDRSIYWVQRVAQGGEVLVPGKRDRPVQLIDVRDLAEWILKSIEHRITGVYNATGPSYPSSLSLERLLQVCKAESRSDARMTWVDDQFLLKAGVKPLEFPFWMPGAHGGGEIDSNKAIDAGLDFRPIEETVRHILSRNATGQSFAPLRIGIARDREDGLLQAWHAQSVPVS